LAQNNSNAYQKVLADSMKRNALSKAALNYPALRQIHISTDMITKSDVTSNLSGQSLFKGKAQTIRTSVLSHH
jgi:hypothetical protein